MAYKLGDLLTLAQKVSMDTNNWDDILGMGVVSALVLMLDAYNRGQNLSIVIDWANEAFNRFAGTPQDFHMKTGLRWIH